MLTQKGRSGGENLKILFLGVTLAFRIGCIEFITVFPLRSTLSAY